MESRRWHCWR